MHTRQTSGLRHLGHKISLVVLAMSLLTVAGEVHAQKKKAESDKESDKVDISDIQKKYWAPKDTDFSVVQNRTYTKDGRIALTANYGPLINDTFSEGNVVGVTANYFMSERYGVHLEYQSYDLEFSEATEKLIDFAGGAFPNHGRPTSYYGVGFSWVPFYAKMSVLGSKIIYFDMAITPVVGITEYDQILIGAANPSETGFTYGLDITQYFFLHNHFALRVDFKNRFFAEEEIQARGNSDFTQGEKRDDKLTDNTLLLFGATLFF